MAVETLLRRALAAQQPRFTKSVATALRYVPFPLQRAVLEPAARQALRLQLANGELDFLRDRVLAIHVRDWQWRLCLSLRNQRLCLRPAGAGADVTIAADADSFLQLANREIDPDTLFFQRRLAIEGDTELGLEVKNFLDAVDTDELPRAFTRALALLARGYHWLNPGPAGAPV